MITLLFDLTNVRDHDYLPAKYILAYESPRSHTIIEHSFIHKPTFEAVGHEDIKNLYYSDWCEYILMKSNLPAQTIINYFSTK